VVMNGWFSHRRKPGRPARASGRYSTGFHMTREAEPVYARHVDYLRRHQPIGCRDRATYNLVRSWGLEAYLSLCCTLTFPTRPARPASPGFVLCDLQEGLLRRSIRKQAIRVSHSIAP